MNKKLINKPLQNKIKNKENEGNEEIINENIIENEKVRLRGRVKHKRNDNIKTMKSEINRINENEKSSNKEQDDIIEKEIEKNKVGFTIANITCNSGELLDKLRKRKEKLVKFNKKIREENLGN